MSRKDGTAPPAAAHSLVYDWGAAEPDDEPGQVSFCDETLREGLQSPSSRHPAVDERLEFLHLLGRLGIEAANVGFPGAGAKARAEAASLCGGIASARLDLQAQCAARTRIEDLEAVHAVAESAGLAIEVGLFIGSSPLRRAAEGWRLDDQLRTIAETVAWAISHGLRVLFVTEDTTRSRPDDVRRLYQEAVRAGASRVCIADTVGFATPAGARRLTAFVRDALGEAGATDVGIDWHGHNDRGLAVACALAAASAGAGRLHGTALGIGERVGNAPMEQLLVNARILGRARGDLSALMDYATLASCMLGVEIPAGQPFVGHDAFSTATGVHAAAMFKALERHDEELLDSVYSAIPSAWLARRQQVEVGPLSGASNIRFWLRSHGYPASEAVTARILESAKAADRVLSEEELHHLARSAVSG